MYKPKIFLVGKDKDDLITLEETGYMEEAVLQDYLVDYPDLLPGDQIDPENPRRWLLVAQEIGVPGEEAGGGRWSLDHLFLDQDGIPTFVECKRATDTRARREVVAQMLDYAANGVEYWSLDRLRQAAAETAQKRGRSLDDEIAKLVDGDEADIEAYWGVVETNLRAHRVRLVFVADSTPRELRRLVEFLNEEMANVEVLAVEVKQFRRETGKGQTALVPRVVGLTEAAREKSSVRERTRALTLQEFMELSTPIGRRFFQQVLDLAEGRGYNINWGRASFGVAARLPKSGSFTFIYCIPAALSYLDVDEFQFYSYYMKESGLEEEALVLRRKLLDSGSFTESGKYTLKVPVTEETLEDLKNIYDSILGEIDAILKGFTGEGREE
jgi:hypothetical protein